MRHHPRPVEMRITPIFQEGSSVLIRLYRRMDRHLQEQGLTWYQLPRSLRLRLTESNIYTLDLISEKEREALVRYRWDRVFAEGRRDRDYHLKRVYLSDPETRPLPDDEGMLDPLAFFANEYRIPVLNVRGPGRLRVQVQRAYGTVELRIRILGIQGDIREERVVLRQPEYWVLKIPEDIHSVVVAPSRPAYLLFEVDHYPEMLVGEAPRLDVGGRWVPIPTVYYRTVYWRTGDPPIVADVRWNGEEGRIVRLTLRTPIPVLDRFDPHPYTLRYRILDESGTVLQEGTFSGEGAATFFDYYALREPETTHIPSGAETFYLPIPPEGYRLVLESSQTVDVALSAPVRDSEPITVDRDLPDDFPVTYRDCQEIERRWYSFRPLNYEDLERQGRRMVVAWQCQHVQERDLEALAQRRALWTTDISTFRTPYFLEPLRPHTPVSLLEHFDPATDPTDLNALVYSEVPAGETVRLRFQDRQNPASRLPVPVKVVRRYPDPRPPHLLLDGEPYAGPIVREEEGSFRIEEVPVGIRAITPVGEALFLNRPPLNLQEVRLWRRRTAYRLERGGALTIEVEKPTEEPVAVNVIVYTPQPIPRTLRGELLNPPPARPTPEQTPHQREYEIVQWEPAQGFILESGRPIEGVQRLNFRLRSDVPPGRYRIRWTIGQGLVFLRFFTMEPPWTYLRPGHAVALNAVGPGRIRAELLPDAPRSVGRAAPELRIEMMDSSGVVHERARPLLRQTVEPIQIPPGLHTITLRVDGPETWRALFFVDGPEEVRPDVEPLFPVREEPILFRPDSYSRTLYSLPLHLSIRQLPLPPPYRLLLRYSLAGPEEAPVVGTVRVRFLDAGGATIAQEELSLPPVVLDPYTEEPGNRFFSEPVALLLLPPPGAASARLEASRPAWVEWSGLLPDVLPDTYWPEDRLGDALVLLDDEAHTRIWQPMELPEAIPGLPVTFYDRSVRERVVPERPPEPTLWTGVDPIQPAPEISVLEETPLVDRESSYGIVGAFRPVQPGEPIPPPPVPGTVQVAFQRRTDVPSELEVLAGGRLIRRLPLQGTSGLLEVRELPPEGVQWRIVAPSSEAGLRLFVNFQTDPERVWFLRTYSRLTADAPLEVRIRKPSREPLALNLTGWLPRSLQRVPLFVRVRPLDVSSAPSAALHFTERERVVYLSSEAPTETEALFLEGDLPFRPEEHAPILPLPITLGDDLPAGDYGVTFGVQGSAVLWVRFFMKHDGFVPFRSGQVAVWNFQGPGRVRIAPQSGRPTPVVARWVSRSGELWEGTLLAPMTLTLPGELVTLTLKNGSEEPIALRIEVDQAEEMLADRAFPPGAPRFPWTPVLPDSLVLTGYRVAPDRPLELELPVLSEEAYLYRLHLRTEASTVEVAELRLEFRGETDQLLGVGRASATFLPSEDATFLGWGLEDRIPSEEVLLYGDLPPGTRRVRLRSDRELFVRLSVRPAALVRSIRIPEDTLERSPVILVEELESEWIPLDPQNDRALALAGRVQRMARAAPRVRLREPEPEDLTPKQAVALHPADPTPTEQFLEPYEPEDPTRLEWTAITFTQVPLGRVVRMHLFNEVVPWSLTPTELRVWFRVDPDRWREVADRRPYLELRVDGHSFSRFPLLLPDGEWAVERVPAGFHDVELAVGGGLVASDLRCYLNRPPADLGAYPIWKRRSVYRLLPGVPVRFLVEKPSTERMTVNLAVAFDERLGPLPERALLRVRVNQGLRPGSVRPTDEYTATVREYSVRIEPGRGFLLGGREVAVTRSQLLFVPLGADMPPGTIPLEVELLTPVSALVRAFWMEPATVEEQVKLWREEARAPME
ncbi:MAG: hypothetical protein KatS3mg115_2577 [Candidatus Poribacteria bacterium]|nr:MAG: hypothetical protein KatS3mg115_2577 [Candidatus Poribacteria bacterium]